MAENMIFGKQRINERIRSEITIEKLCKKNEINVHKYYYWDNRISEKQRSDKEKTC